jgi:rhodanese-related sulfurtransferase
MCRNVSPQDAYNMIQTDKDIEILDVRTPMEYHNDGRIPGARLIPINEIQFRLNELNPAKKYLVYCRTGNRSSQVCRFLSGLGFKNIYNQAGGVVQWGHYGLPLEGGRTMQRAPGVFYF